MLELRASISLSAVEGRTKRWGEGAAIWLFDCVCKPVCVCVCVCGGILLPKRIRHD